MDTSEETLRKWGNGRIPLPASYPKIIAFLGKAPWQEPRGLAQQLRCARLARGLTIEQAAVQLGVNPSTMWWWETGRKPHRVEDRTKVAAFVEAGFPPQADSPPPGEDVGEERETVLSVGALLRTRRQELRLTLDAAAERIGSNTWTLLSWEHDRRRPTDRFYPALIRFLGREPWPEPQTLGERLRAERLRRGLSYEQVAAIMRVDPGLLPAWEAGRGPHHERSKANVEAFIMGKPRP